VIKRLHNVLADILANPTERADIEQKGYDVVASTAEPSSKQILRVGASRLSHCFR